MLRNETDTEEGKSWLVYLVQENHRSILCLFVLEDNNFILFDVFLCEYVYKFPQSAISQISKASSQNLLRFNVNENQYILDIWADESGIINEICAHIYFDKAGFAGQKLIQKFAATCEKFTVLKRFNQVTDVVLKLSHTIIAINTNELTSSKLLLHKLWFLNGIHWLSPTEVIISFEGSDETVTLETFDSYQLNKIILYLLSRVSYHSTKEYNINFTTNITEKTIEIPTSVTTSEDQTQSTDSPKNMDSYSFPSESDVMDTTETIKEISQVTKPVFETKPLTPDEKVSFIEEVLAKKPVKCIQNCTVC